MIFNVSGGGGTALNFRVVGGTTAPANPAENCIWVNTETPITSWIFSATEPSPAEAGMVWFPVGTTSPVEFNALKKNGIQVYPLKAQQYVGGAWVNVTAKSYQGGELVEWVTYLYKDGNEFATITGGWSKSVSGSYAAVTENTDSFTVKYTQGGDGVSAYCTDEPIDLTGFSKIKVKATEYSGATSNGAKLGVFTDRPHTNYATWVSLIVAQVPITSVGEFELDVSAINQPLYIAVGSTYSNTYSATVSEVKLEA